MVLKTGHRLALDIASKDRFWTPCQLIFKIYEVDPLQCPQGGSDMTIIAYKISNKNKKVAKTFDEVVSRYL